MTTAQRYFLAIAEAQSISAAAGALYVSQQNLSNFVKKLEDEYGLLFVRKPRFALTPAGEALLAAIREIRLVEAGLDLRVRELREKNVGKLRLGMNMGRARAFLPPLLSAYYRDYPNMELCVVHEETRNFEQLLLKGELDMFFGVNVSPRAEFAAVELGREPIYLAASPRLLESAGAAPGAGALTPEQAAGLPLILSPRPSTLRQKAEEFFAGHRLSISPRIVADDLDLQLALVREGVGACFCPGMMLSSAARPGGGLAVLPVEGMEESNELALVYHRAAYVSGPMRGLMDLIERNIPDMTGMVKGDGQDGK